MKKAILYARVGFTLQNESTKILEKQFSDLSSYCKNNNIEVLEVYSETAAGNTFEREEFKKLLTALRSKKSKVDFLLFTEWFRLSSNVKESIEFYTELEKLGIEAKAINDDSTSKNFFRILQLTKKK